MTKSIINLQIINNKGKTSPPCLPPPAGRAGTSRRLRRKNPFSKNQSPSRKVALNPDAWRKDFYMVTSSPTQSRSPTNSNPRVNPPSSDGACLPVRQGAATPPQNGASGPASGRAEPRPQPRRSGTFTFCYSKVQRPAVVPRSGTEVFLFNIVMSVYVWGLGLLGLERPGKKKICRQPDWLFIRENSDRLDA